MNVVVSHFSSRQWLGLVLAMTSFIALLLTPALAGGGPRNVAVVINYNSAVSREIGRYYQQVRDIPDCNICNLTCPDDEIVPWQVCERQIREPLVRFLSAPVLADRIDYIVLTKGVPLGADYVDGVVVGSIDHYYSVASALLDLNRSIVDLTGSGGVPDGAPDNAIPYAFPYGPNPFMTWGFTQLETAWSHTLFDNGDKWDINKRFYLVTRLDAYTVDQVKAMIDRASNPALDGIYVLDKIPSASGLYDKANSRLGSLPTSAYDYLTKRGFDVRFDSGTQFINDVRGVMGYFSWANHDIRDPSAPNPLYDYSFTKYKSNVFVPGSIADTYWSYSGKTFTDPGTTDREPLIAELFASGLCGAGAYVSEPQVSTASFANTLFDRYTKGYNMAESYYMACPNGMWKTVIIGDPLMAPYATPPILNIGLDHTSLQGTETIPVSASDDSGVKKVVFYLDDELVGTALSYPYSINLNTEDFTIGPHVIEDIAYENSSLATQGSAKLNVTIDNQVSAVSTIDDALQYADGQDVKVKSKIVTAGTDEIGDGFYIEESDRSAAVKIISSQRVQRGDIVTVSGVVSTENSLRLLRVTNGANVSVQTSGASIPKPLAMRLMDLGGAALGDHNPAVGLGRGPHNVALLVRVAGRVTSISDGEFFITDNSVEAPVKIICPGVVPPPIGSTVGVTGICESENDGLNLTPVIRSRTSDDIQIF